MLVLIALAYCKFMVTNKEFEIGYVIAVKPRSVHSYKSMAKIKCRPIASNYYAPSPRVGSTKR